MAKGYSVKRGLISRAGFPESSRYYREAHSEASNAEKKKFPKGYQELKKLDNKVPQGKMIGHNTKSGKLSVSSAVPKKLRKEVAFHEKYESKAIKRLSRKKKA